jgi:hypothetical protein
LTADAGRPISDRPAQVVFGLLVIACFAAFFVTQRLKHTPTAVQEFRLGSSFVAGLPGTAGEERISFKSARADEATVAIVDSAGDRVATLVAGRPVERYKQVYLRWNGRRGEAHGYTVLRSPHGLPILLAENTGPLAPAGEYRVQVILSRQHKMVLSPSTFTLVHRPLTSSGSGRG